MSSILNRPAYTVEKDRLIYDGTYPIDGDAVPVTITADTDGVIKRGTIIDFDETTRKYTIHKEGGTPNRIAAEDTEYVASDTVVIVPNYAGGTFRTSEVAADPELTGVDIEALRGVGISTK